MNPRPGGATSCTACCAVTRSRPATAMRCTRAVNTCQPDCAAGEGSGRAGSFKRANSEAELHLDAPTRAEVVDGTRAARGLGADRLGLCRHELGEHLFGDRLQQPVLVAERPQIAGACTHSLDWLAGPWRESGIVSVPADGPVSWTAREDAAEAAALILVAAGPLDGPVTITAREATSFEQVAAIASEITGRTIGFELLDPDDWIAAQVAAGSPERLARFTLGMFQAAAGGLFAGIDPLLEGLLGREPRTVREQLAAATA